MDIKEEEESVVAKNPIENESGEVNVSVDDREGGDSSVVKENINENEVGVLRTNTKRDVDINDQHDTEEDELTVKRCDEEDGLVLKMDIQNDELSTERCKIEDKLSVTIMNIKSEAEEDRPSTYEVLQQISEGAVRVAGEAFQNFSNPKGHRRSHSDMATSNHKRMNSFQRLRSQMQRAWRWGGNPRDDISRPSFNPEVLANQKRQWYQLHSKTREHANYKDPASFFEHFIIVGLHPEANLAAVEDAVAKKKQWEKVMSQTELGQYKILHQRGPQLPALDPQILFKYPPGKKLAIRAKDLAAFCFPGGVKPRLLEKTPSLSDLNELVYGQEHLGRDDASFVFSLKVADNATLYGVCLHVSEIVQRPPGILSSSSPLLHTSGLGSRFLFAAPRCYCLLTGVPFFELHFAMLNSLIQQERLNRITQFVTEMSLTSADHSHMVAKLNKEMNENADSHDTEYYDNWMSSAIPVDQAVALTAAAAGIISDDGCQLPSTKLLYQQSPENGTGIESSDAIDLRETDKDGKKSSLYLEDHNDDVLDNQSDAQDRTFRSYESGPTSPEIASFNARSRNIFEYGSYELGPSSPEIASFNARSRSIFEGGSFEKGSASPDMAGSSSRLPTLERVSSSESLFSSAKSVVSEDDNENLRYSTSETDFGDDLIMEWARDHKNCLLQIVCDYHRVAIPSRGSEFVFQPLEHLQAIHYRRAPVSALGYSDESLALFEASEIQAKLAAAEEALTISLWTTATVCRVLSLDSVLSLLAGVLLEKQMVIVCPNLGILSAVVLSLIPMIRPFQWQSLLLPVLPGRMIDFLDAPVPFIVGIHNNSTELKLKTANLIQVNVAKDQVRTCKLPALPRRQELLSQLGPIHSRLAYQLSAAKRNPVYRCNDVQAQAANELLNVMRNYMESLCSDLRSHAITSVQSDSDRVSLLLKDSFVDSFPRRDRPFVKLFVDTQLFSVLSDSRL